MKQAFLGMKSSLDSSIKSQNRNTGGAPKKRKASGKKGEQGDNNPPAEPPSITPLQNLRKEKTRQEKIRQEKKRESNPSFSLQCLKALNEELRGVAPVEFTRNPYGGYIASLEGTFTVDDVREMVRFKRKEWEGTKFQQNLNPVTLFSPEKFESYVIASKMKEPTKSIRGRKVMDDELASYAS